MVNKSRNISQVQGSLMSSSSLDEKDKPTKVISNLGPKIAAKKRDRKGKIKP